MESTLNEEKPQFWTVLTEDERFVARNGDFGSPTDDLGAVHRRDSEIFVWIRFLVKLTVFSSDWTDKTAN